MAKKRAKRPQRKLNVKILIVVVLIMAAIGSCFYWQVFSINPRSGNFFAKNYYTAEDFNIKTLVSQTDRDGDGIDDYRALLLGAREYVETNPQYKSRYYQGGYPTDEYGVCTDVIWHAFKRAGYSLKDLVDDDIANNLSAYPNVDKPDPHIDFRRVKNLHVFFQRQATSLTLDLNKIEEWQPGDIVIYANRDHIGIVSDRRNKKGQPYLIHHMGQLHKEEDALRMPTLVGHYRWQK
ncbi:MAG: DUF1287 domain-containing protein [Bacillota bacterium]|jgi:uncharacterized protein YijF (DUF1287 family)